MKLASVASVKSGVKLEYEDPKAPDNGLVEIYNSVDLNYEKAMWSYNNVIDT